MADPAPVLRALPAGAAFIYRDYDDPWRRRRARELAALCRSRGVFFLVAGDPDLAHEVRADGLHWPAWRARPPSVRPFTVACHSAEELAAAAWAGARAAFLSPVFPTASHADAEALGAERFKRLAAKSPVPVFALGGVDEATAPRLSGPNVVGLGAIGAFLAR